MAHRRPACQLPLSTRGKEALGTTEKIDHFLTTKRPNLSCVVIDLDVVRARYSALCICFPDARIFYAVKANPAADVLATLASAGANFDLAGEGEIARCRSLGITPDRFSFGDTVKRETEIARARGSSVDLFAFDSINEVEKIARAAPGAQAFCRMLIDAKGADWPLTRKFGCDAKMAADLLAHARSLGLRPRGVSSRLPECRRRIAGAVPHAHTSARDLCGDHRSGIGQALWRGPASLISFASTSQLSALAEFRRDPRGHALRYRRPIRRAQADAGGNDVRRSGSGLTHD